MIAKPPKRNGDAERFIDDLLAWMTAAGETRYDEAVTQSEHALQAAALADAEDGGGDAVVAALLHDVGHLLANEFDGRRDFLAQDLRHEDIAAKWLTPLFGPGVVEPIRLHVAAKRYICAVEPAYADTLSVASTRSLELQGGPMTDEEVAAFAAEPHLDAALALRRRDEGAKVAGRAVPGYATYRQRLVERLLPA